MKLKTAFEIVVKMKSRTFTKGHPGIALFSVALLLVTSACAAKNIQGEHWVIFSAELAEEQGIGSWLAGDIAVEYWTPAEEDIRALESGLALFLQENPDRLHSQELPVWERLDEYNRQYIGIVLNGNQIIYANYFCDSVGDWKKQFVFVMDGGDCFFQFQYDVDTAEYFDLQVNGDA